MSVYFHVSACVRVGLSVPTFPHSLSLSPTLAPFSPLLPSLVFFLPIPFPAPAVTSTHLIEDSFACTRPCFLGPGHHTQSASSWLLAWLASGSRVNTAARAHARKHAHTHIHSISSGYQAWEGGRGEGGCYWYAAAGLPPATSIMHSVSNVSMCTAGYGLYVRIRLYSSV